MKKIAILGSCVTRDPFAFLKRDDWRITEYIARGSIVGLFDPPLAYDPTWYAGVVNFERRCVETDLKKDAVSRILRADFDFLVLDFIDERFDLLDIHGTRVGNTKHVRQTGFQQRYDAVTRPLDRLSPEVTRLWQIGMERFLGVLRTCVPEEKLVLHEARWAGTSRGQSESNESSPQVVRNNELLERYFQTVRESAPDAHTIRVPDQLLLSDPDHVWSKEPFHYVKEYYENFLFQLDALHRHG